MAMLRSYAYRPRRRLYQKGGRRPSSTAFARIRKISIGRQLEYKRLPENRLDFEKRKQIRTNLDLQPCHCNGVVAD